MKKVILLSLVASATLLSANDEGYYFTPTIGKVINESSDLNKEKIYGFRVGMPVENQYGLDTFEFAYDRQTGVDYTSRLDSTKTNRFSANFLKHYNYTTAYTPYGLAGIGYETFSNEQLDANDALFLNVGVGIKYKINENFSLMTDVRHLIRLDEFDSHTIFDIGLVIPFGKVQKQAPVVVEEKKVAPVVIAPKDSDNDGVIDEKDLCPTTKAGVKVDANGCEIVVAPKDSDNDGVIDEKDLCPTTKAGVKVDANGCEIVVAPKDSDNDGVIDEKDLCPTTKAGVKVDANGCEIVVAPKDSDNDGVIDEKDKCPNTPTGFTVDASGCEISYNLKINFDTNKADIKPQYNDEISKFVLFMNTFPAYKAEIGGHTDNVGDAVLNKKLSTQRANSVKERFTKEGVETTRMTAVGYGEEKPVASNDTVEGRDENRRIEVILSK
ncbi:MAG: OmpA family protein [Arcobacteraceae bacterium]|nr:OmpA family protein [Arcobacteraceae bacterium]